LHIKQLSYQREVCGAKPIFGNQLGEAWVGYPFTEGQKLTVELAAALQ